MENIPILLLVLPKKYTNIFISTKRKPEENSNANYYKTNNRKLQIICVDIDIKAFNLT